MRGEGVKKLQKTQPCESDSRKDERQCNAALVPRCIYPIEICDDK